MRWSDVRLNKLDVRNTAYKTTPCGTEGVHPKHDHNPNVKCEMTRHDLTRYDTCSSRGSAGLVTLHPHHQVQLRTKPFQAKFSDLPQPSKEGSTLPFLRTQGDGIFWGEAKMWINQRLNCLITTIHLIRHVHCSFVEKRVCHIFFGSEILRQKCLRSLHVMVTLPALSTRAFCSFS